MEFIELIEAVKEAIPPEGAGAAAALGAALPWLTLLATLLTCFFGHKLHRIWLQFVLFCIGFVLGLVVSAFFPQEVSFTYFIVLGVVLGGLGVYCTRWIHKAQLFLMNAFFVYAALPELLEKFLPGGLSVFIGLAAAVIVGILAVRYKFLVTMITTAVTGASSAVHQIFHLLNWNEGAFLWGMMILLAAAGLLVQYLVEKEEIMEARNRIADKSKHVREKLSKNRSQPSEPGTEQTECRPGAESIQP